MFEGRNTQRLMFWHLGLFAVGMLGAVLSNGASAFAEIRDELLPYDPSSPCASFEQAAHNLRDMQESYQQSQRQDENLLLMQQLGNFGQEMAKQLTKQCNPSSFDCINEMSQQNLQAQSHFDQRQAGRNFEMSQLSSKLDRLRFEQRQCEDMVERFVTKLREVQRSR
ncbi:MAG: hypothetical protein WBK08_18135 [Nitrospira sp.]|nr:MAG: hypothetical protein E8D42_13180 [Nitrospira sp.]